MRPGLSAATFVVLWALPPKTDFRSKDMWLEPAFRQFMGGTEARHTAAEDGYFL